MISLMRHTCGLEVSFHANMEKSILVGIGNVNQSGRYEYNCNPLHPRYMSPLLRLVPYIETKKETMVNVVLRIINSCIPLHP